MLLTSVTTADTDSDGSEEIVAWIVTVLGEGKSAGAVYRMEFGAAPAATGRTVPTSEFPPTIPFTSQVMEFPAAEQSETVNTWLALSETMAEGGEIEGVERQAIVTVAETELAGAATLDAVTVTEAGAGGTAGAV
jgi:hypothetical protein